MFKKRKMEFITLKEQILIVLLSATIFLGSFWIDSIEDLRESFTVTLILGVIRALCFSFFFFYLFDMGNDSDKRRKAKLRSKKKEEIKSVKIPLDEILLLCEENDVLRLEILTDTDIVDTGASSDMNRRTGKFIDKTYYINESHFDLISDYREALLALLNDNQTLSVITMED